MDEPKLRISEIFSSVQGEGQWLGVPSTFVRVSGCNLRCAWCDTPYASWSPEGPILTVEDVLEQVVELGQRHVVVTGGEPMLFDAIEPFLAGLRTRGHRITIETAGTVFREVEADLVSISPKLANSTPTAEMAGEAWVEKHEAIRKDVGPLRKLLARYPYQIKFVVRPDRGLGELDEITAILDAVGPVDSERIFLMAEGVRKEDLLARQKLLVPTCLERGWRLAPRLHIDLFGDTRGT